jgi:ABC-2 type transport system permease protein
MILAVAKNRLWNLSHDRAAFVLSFIVPIVFFTIFGSIFGGDSGRAGTRRVRVAVAREDDSDQARKFVSGLQAEKGLEVLAAPVARDGTARPPFTAATAEAAVRAGEVPVALIVPAGFGEKPVRFGPSFDRPRVTILADPSDPIAGEVLSGLVQRVTVTALAGVPASSASLIEIDRREVLGDRKSKNPMIAFYAAGLGVMFLLFSAAGAGGALIEEVETGTLDRILSTRVSMNVLLGGKLVYLAGLATMQLLVMFLWGSLVFGLPMRGHWIGFAVMTLSTALACSTFGLLLAAISRSRMQLVAISNLAVLVMSAVGGSMFPRFLMPPLMQKFGLVTLNAWAIDGFQKVFWREEPLTHLWPQVLVLTAIAVVFFILARRIARKWEAA